MSRFSLTIFAANGRARAITHALQAHLAIVNVVLLALVVSLAAFYIIQINAAVTHGYQIRELETTIHTLTLENQRLDVATREVQSLENVTSSMKMLGMVPSGTPHYVSTGTPSVAMAE